MRYLSTRARRPRAGYFSYIALLFIFVSTMVIMGTIQLHLAEKSGSDTYAFLRRDRLEREAVRSIVADALLAKLGPADPDLPLTGGPASASTLEQIIAAGLADALSNGTLAAAWAMQGCPAQGRPPYWPDATADPVEWPAGAVSRGAADFFTRGTLLNQRSLALTMTRADAAGTRAYDVQAGAYMVPSCAYALLQFDDAGALGSAFHADGWGGSFSGRAIAFPDFLRLPETSDRLLGQRGHIWACQVFPGALASAPHYLAALRAKAQSDLSYLDFGEGLSAPPPTGVTTNQTGVTVDLASVAVDLVVIRNGSASVPAVRILGDPDPVLGPSRAAAMVWVQQPVPSVVLSGANYRPAIVYSSGDALFDASTPGSVWTGQVIAQGAVSARGNVIRGSLACRRAISNGSAFSVTSIGPVTEALAPMSPRVAFVEVSVAPQQ